VKSINEEGRNRQPLSYNYCRMKHS